jgi:hypothetical protein
MFTSSFNTLAQAAPLQRLKLARKLRHCFDQVHLGKGRVDLEAELGGAVIRLPGPRVVARCRPGCVGSPLKLLTFDARGDQTHA